MNSALLIHEYLVLGLAFLILLADLWLPVTARRKLGYTAAAGLFAILLYSIFAFKGQTEAAHAFGNMYVLDDLALFFKRFFLVAAIIVIIMSVEFADKIEAGISEFYSLVLFALSGMLFASSANSFALLFVSLELITVTFYILTSFQRSRVVTLEAGVKYLIIGALSTSFTVFGIALVYGISGKLDFSSLASLSGELAVNKVFLFGLLLVVIGIGFKIGAFPVQIWAPDVYQGSPTPTGAFLATGSKAAGFVLLIRVLFIAVPDVSVHWSKLLMLISAITILYGNLCALPQKNIKRLLGYSSISHAGYLLLGIAALNDRGISAVLYYLSGYLFTVLAAFTVICIVMREADAEWIGSLAGLNQRSPLLALSISMAMVSLAGIPPLAGFFGKFLLLKAVIEKGPADHAYYWLAFAAVAGVVISIYYYFGVIRAIYWSDDSAIADRSTIPVSKPTLVTVYVCIAGMLYIGIFPGALVNWTKSVAQNVGPRADLPTVSAE